METIVEELDFRLEADSMLDIAAILAQTGATRGGAGDDHTGAGRTGDALGAVRERELQHAAAALGVAEAEVVGFADSGWDGPAPANALINGNEALVTAVRDAAARHRPRVVVTMDPTAPTGIETTRRLEPPRPRLRPARGCHRALPLVPASL